MLEGIREQAWEGFTAFGHGGLEVGGLLWGRRSEDCIRVASAIPFESDHALGPGFMLSANDEARLAAHLESAPERADGLDLVGWYKSFTRSDIRFSERDEPMRKRFPEDWQITLGVQPARFGPARAVLFFGQTSNPHGVAFQIGGESPQSETAAPAEEDRPSLPAPEPARWPDPPVVYETAPPARRGERPAAAVRTGLAPVFWIPAVFFIAIGLGATAAWIAGPGAPDRGAGPAQPSPLHLRAARQHVDLRIEWDHASPAVLQASSAALEVNDGGHSRRFELDPVTLRTGTIVYHPLAADVTIGLRLQGKGGETLAEETIRHLLPVVPFPPEEKFAIPRSPAPSTVVVAVRSRENGPAARQEPTGRPVTVQPDPPPPPVRLTRPFRQPAATAELVAQPLPPPPGPESTAEFTPPQIPAPLPATPPAYRGPRSGRLIWTGSLERRGVVEIENGKASMGTLSGALPGLPVDLRAMPAELGSKGLVIYSHDGRLNAAPRVEPPGQGNGWNRTTFEYEPARARTIAILETPNPTNSYRRLVLRSDGPHSVVVIEWTLK